mmetsp:Transcript_23068/g.59325  ORF Transcript_23068/g.59325 Transcript_23068/m.59325 type:complete len:240 (-) Transcript_23068:478-1197(-)
MESQRSSNATLNVLEGLEVNGVDGWDHDCLGRLGDSVEQWFQISVSDLNMRVQKQRNITDGRLGPRSPGGHQPATLGQSDHSSLGEQRDIGVQLLKQPRVGVLVAPVVHQHHLTQQMRRRSIQNGMHCSHQWGETLVEEDDHHTPWQHLVTIPVALAVVLSHVLLGPVQGQRVTVPVVEAVPFVELSKHVGADRLGVGRWLPPWCAIRLQANATMQTIRGGVGPILLVPLTFFPAAPAR